MRLGDLDALKKSLNFVYDCSYIESKSKEGIASDIIDAIDNAPTVAVNCKDCDGYEAGYSAGLKDAERPQGEWIFVAENELARSMDGEKLTTYKCPLCERMLITFPSKLTDYPFCHCGADMRGGGTNE